MGQEDTGVVGRGRELALLDEALDAAQAGSSARLAVVGDPGIGKSRLLRELRARAGARGMEVLTGRAVELERDAPLELVIDALDEPFARLVAGILPELDEDQVAELGSVLSTFADRSSRRVSPLHVDRLRAHRAVRDALRLVARRRPVLLALDDVHWADHASLELVAHLLRHGVPGVALAVAYRPRHAPRLLVDPVAASAVEGDLAMVELGPLTLEQATQLLAGTYGVAGDVGALHAETGGNPFYLEQLARSAATTSGERAVDAPARDAGGEVPPAVRSSIAREVAALGDDGRVLLDASAVVGEPGDPALVAEVADVSWSAALAAVDELVATGILRLDGAPQVLSFRHPIVRRAVYDAIPAGRRLGMHRLAAEGLRARGAGVRVRAHHVERSAGVGAEDAIATLVEAGDQAALRAPATAAHWYGAALRLLPDAAPVERRLRTLLALAEVLAAVGRLEESRRALREALGLLPPEATEMRERVTVMVARADQALGEHGEARRMLGAALASATPRPAAVAALRLELSTNRFMAGAWEDAARHARAARALAEAIPDETLLVVAGARLAYLAQYVDSVADARAARDAAARHLDATSDAAFTPALLEGLFELVAADTSLELLGSAAANAARGVRLSRELGQGFLYLQFGIEQAFTHMLQGRLAEARAGAESAAEEAVLLGNDAAAAFAGAALTWVAAQQGDLDRALGAGRAAADAAARAPGAAYAWFARACHGDALILAGHVEHGRAEIVDVLDDVPPGARPYWYRVLVDAELSRGDVPAARKLAAGLDELVAGRPLDRQWADALIARSLVLSADGALVAAADAAGEAAARAKRAESPVWEATARLVAGRALARAGRPADAERALELAHAKLEAAGAYRLADEAGKELRALGRRVRRTRRRTGTGGIGLDDLTGRELEVAERVSWGHSNRQIAAELFVSEKTVEKHLTRVFAKVGVASRAALAAAVERARRAGAPAR